MFKNEATNITQEDNMDEAAGGFPLLDSANDILSLFGGIHSPLIRAVLFVFQSVGMTDISLLVWGATVFLVWKSASQFWDKFIMAFVQRHFMASITMDGHDDISDHVMKWLADQPQTVNSRNLAAETNYRLVWEEESDVVNVDGLVNDERGRWLNFSNTEARTPPRYVPAHGSHFLWFNRRFFILSRSKETVMDNGAWGGTLKDKDTITIATFGWSPEPIKMLIQHCKSENCRGRYQRTIIKRPNSHLLKRSGARNSWSTVASRPVRPIETVVLDEKQKLQVLADMNEYLHPATPHWYANRGIPLRRGYLFHGPPGTGKTSLSFALAGVFGLSIYVISLLDPNLTEEDLSTLFNGLPRRCIVLLEDIDTAGLKRSLDDEVAIETNISGRKGKRDAETVEVNKNSGIKHEQLANENELKQLENTEKSNGAFEHEKLLLSLTKALRKSRVNEEEKKQGISLSGLLNAIDGVASHEGRVLIMTTNKPESLDEALIRPGRVDMQIAFSNATRQQAQELFQRMYDADCPQETHEDFVQCSSEDPNLFAVKATRFITKSLRGKLSTEQAMGQGSNKMPHKNGTSEILTDYASNKLSRQSQSIASSTNHDNMCQVESMAIDFASRIPDGNFSPAEIQGFLLKRKKKPQQALNDVQDWAESLVAQKSSKRKVVQVQ